MKLRAPAMVRLLLALILAPAVVLAEDDVELVVAVDSDVVHEGESFNFTIQVVGPMRGSKAPVLPDLEDFAMAGTSSSSNFSFVNGRTSSTKSYRYTLIPLRAGELRIPAIPVTVKGKIHLTQPVKLTVQAAAAAPAARGGAQVRPEDRPSVPGAESRSSSAGDTRVFINSWLDTEQVYVGQQLTHHFALFRRPTVNFLGTPQYAPPEFTGFWTEPLGDEISGYRQLEGQNYAVTELRRALFPNEPGTLSIGSATVHLRLREGGRFEFFSFDSGPEKVLRTKPLSVEVLPLPEAGKPAGFKGTVATSLNLELRVDPGPYEAGQPVTATLLLSGYGNPRTFAEPDYAAGEAFKSYDSELQIESRVDQQRIRVEKRFTRVLVPKQPGRHALPGVSYHWFDPERGVYRSKTTPDRVLEVAPSTSRETAPVVFGDLTPERVELLGRDIHHIKTDPALAGDGARFPRSPAFWSFLALPCPLLVGTLVWRRRRDALRADAAGFRARGARKSAGLRLRDAEAARKAGDYDLFCSKLDAGLRGYLVDRLRLSAGFTNDEAGAALRAGGVSGALGDRTLEILGDCDFARYAPGSEQLGRMDRLLETAGALLAELDRETAGRRGVKRGFRGGGLLLIFALAILAPAGVLFAVGDASLRMAEGAACYEAGDFAEAAEIWQNLGREGLEDSHLWYNLGNARFHRGEIGRAILAYRRALRLAPRNAELRDNLALARARRPDGLDSALSSAMTDRAWRWVRASFSPGDLAVIGLALLWIGTLLVLLGILRIVRWHSLRVGLILVALLLPLVSAAAWAAEWRDWSGREAVLLASVVAVNSGPGADFITLFEIHEGAELRLREERGSWVRVSLGEDLEGWIPRGSFETL